MNATNGPSNVPWNDPAEAFGRYAREFFSPYFNDEDDDEDFRDESEVGMDPDDMWFDLSRDDKKSWEELRGE